MCKYYIFVWIIILWSASSIAYLTERLLYFIAYIWWICSRPDVASGLLWVGREWFYAGIPAIFEGWFSVFSMRSNSGVICGRFVLASVISIFWGFHTNHYHIYMGLICFNWFSFFFLNVLIFWKCLCNILEMFANKLKFIYLLKYINDD